MTAIKNNLPNGVQAGLVILKKIPENAHEVPHGGIAQLPLQDERHVAPNLDHSHLGHSGSDVSSQSSFKPLAEPYKGKFNSLFESAFGTSPNNAHETHSGDGNHGLSSSETASYNGKFNSLFDSSIGTNHDIHPAPLVASSILGDGKGEYPTGSTASDTNPFKGNVNSFFYDTNNNNAPGKPLQEIPVGPSGSGSLIGPSGGDFQNSGPSGLGHISGPSGIEHNFQITGPTPLPEAPHQNSGPSGPTVNVNFKPTVDNSIVSSQLKFEQHIISAPSGGDFKPPNQFSNYPQPVPEVMQGFKPLPEDYKFSSSDIKLTRYPPGVKLPLKTYVPPRVFGPKPPSTSYGVPEISSNDYESSKYGPPHLQFGTKLHPKKPHFSSKPPFGPSGPHFKSRPPFSSSGPYFGPKPPGFGSFGPRPSKHSSFGPSGVYFGPKPPGFGPSGPHFGPKRPRFGPPTPPNIIPFGTKVPGKIESDFEISGSGPSAPPSALSNEHQIQDSSSDFGHLQSPSSVGVAPVSFDVVQSLNYELPLSKRQTHSMKPRPFEKTGRNNTRRT